MLELFADWEPLPSVASIRAATCQVEPLNVPVPTPVNDCTVVLSSPHHRGHTAAKSKSAPTLAVQLPLAATTVALTATTAPLPTLTQAAKAVPQLTPLLAAPVCKHTLPTDHALARQARPLIHQHGPAEQYPAVLKNQAPEYPDGQFRETYSLQSSQQAVNLGQAKPARFDAQLEAPQRSDLQLSPGVEQQHAAKGAGAVPDQGGSPQLPRFEAHKFRKACTETNPEQHSTPPGSPWLEQQSGGDASQATPDQHSTQQLSPFSEQQSDRNAAEATPPLVDQQHDGCGAEATPGQSRGSGEEGETAEEGELAETAAKPKRRGERAGKRVRQRIAKRAREKELHQQQLEAGVVPQQTTPRKVQKKDRPACKYFLFGKCSKGDACPFPHEGQPVTSFISCRYFHQGTCQKGEACQYSHDDNVEPCKQLVLHGVCRFGPTCHFSHDSLPAYAVKPLQEWFKEQDQLKLDRSARNADEAMQTTPSHLDRGGHHADGMEQDINTADEQGSALQAMHAPVVGSDCNAMPQYSSWSDGWKRLYGNRLQKLPESGNYGLQESAQPEAAAAFVPLSGPYTSWQDGWNRLFAQDRSKAPQTTEQV